MKEDELAMTIAALITATKGEKRIKTLASTLPKYLLGYNFEAIRQKINHYIENPPRDNFASLAVPLTDGTYTS
jgi:hypothetical protein